MIDLKQALVSALQLQQAGDVAAAVEVYRDVLLVDPANPDAHHLLGLAALQVGNPAAAEPLIGKAVALAPGEPAYRLDWGRALAAAGRVDEARSRFTELLAADPLNAGAIGALRELPAPSARGGEAAAVPVRKPKLKRADIPAAVQQGVELQRQGRRDDAAAVYKAILACDPENPDGLNLLGVVLHEQGDNEMALHLLRKAVKRAPGAAMVHTNLGLVLHALGKVADAARAYEQAIALDPAGPQAYLNLGSAREDLGDGDGALACYRQALALDAGFVMAWQNLGKLLNRVGGGEAGLAELEKAVALAPLAAGPRVDLAAALLRLDRDAAAAPHLDAAMALDPASADVQNTYGWLLQKQGRTQAALEHYRRAIGIRPRYAEALNNLGAVLNETGCFGEALEPLQQALAIKPSGYLEPLINLSVVLNNLERHHEALAYVERGLGQAPTMAELWNSSGCIHRNLARFDVAEAHFRKALEYRPGFIDALNNLALMLRARGLADEAVQLYRDALASGKHDHVLRHNLGLALLSNGELAEGWQCYEARWRVVLHNVAGRFPQPWWNGEDLRGKRILARAEQGVGDEIMFASPIADLAARSARCLIEVDKRLVDLFARSFPATQVFARTDPPAAELVAPDVDFQVSFGNAFRWLRPTVDAFPRHGGFLVADPQRVAHWRARLAALGAGPVVGISWRSRLVTHLRKAEFTELPEWGPIFAIPGIRFVNLQYDESRAEIEQAEKLFGIRIHRFDDEVDLFNDLDGAAALTAACDVVVSAPTSVSAMAGALGVPCYRMTVPEDWTDLGQKDWVPFFPSVELVKRRLDEDWTRVIAEVAERLTNRPAATAG